MAPVDLQRSSDAELAEHIGAGSTSAPAAEAEVWVRYAHRIKLYGLRHLRSESAADDLVQRTVVLTLQRLRAGEVREPAKLGSFVLGTARTLVQVERRKGQREELQDPTTLADRAAAAGAFARDPLLQRTLQVCIDQLGERERSVVLLSIVLEQDAQFIGEGLGMEPNHVRVTRFRALAKLRACMDTKSPREAHR